MKKTTHFQKKLGIFFVIISLAVLSSLFIYSCDKPELMKEEEKTGEGFSQLKLRSGGPDNLVTNPSFEVNLNGWESWQGSLSRVSLGDAPDGSYVAKVTRSTGTSYTIDDNPATVQSTTSGQSYWASVWVKAASASGQGKTVTLRLRELNAGGTLVKETVSPGLALTNSFQQLFVSVTGAGSGNTLDIRISQTGAVSGDAFYADLFELTLAPEGNTIANSSFESNLTGWESWQGSLSRVALTAPDGGYVVKVTRSSGTSYTIDDNPASVSSTTAGQEYLANTWVKAASTSSQGKSVTLRLREINAGGELVQEWTSAAVLLNDNFQKLSVRATANGSGNTLDIRASQTGAASGDAFYADLFVLRPGDYTPPPPPPTVDPAEKRPFDPDHPVYHPIPANCPLYQYSSQIVSNIAANYTKINIDDKGETPPIYVGTPSDPTWTLVMPNGTFNNVHAPDNIQSGTGDDWPLVILDKSSAQYNGHPVEYRMWRADIYKSQHRIECQGGGVGVYANDGRILDDIPIQSGRVNRALGQAEISGWNTGSGCSYTVGMIRPIDVQRGRIDHAIRVAIGYPHPTRWFWPALSTETWNKPANNNMAPMGARIFIDHSVNIEALGNAVAARLPDAKNKAFAKMLVRAMQEYGFIALDGSGNNNVYLEGRNTADWLSLIGPRNAWDSYGDIGRAIEAELPYNMLRVADPSVFDGYGR